MPSIRPSQRPSPQPACRACWRTADPAPGAKRSCIEVQEWPVIVMIASGVNSREQLDCRIRQFEALFDRDEPFALVLDLRDAKNGGERGSRLTDWMDARDDVIRRNCAAVALVFKNSFVRFMISSVLLVMRRPVPYRVFEEPADAVRWCREMTAARAGAASRGAPD